MSYCNKANSFSIYEYKKKRVLPMIEVYKTSMAIAIPMPPPIQSAATPLRPPVRFNA